MSISAYHEDIFLAGDAIYLVGDRAAYRLLPGEEPLSLKLDLGIGPTLTHSSFVYWSNGAVYRAPKEGGPPRRVCECPHQPQYFVAAADRFAWIDRSDDGKYSIQTASRNEPALLASPPGRIDAAVMLDDWIFFVEASDSSWRIGGAREPGKIVYSSPKQGRPPAMLAAYEDRLYYYDTNQYEIVELSPDLQHEESWGKDVICSPIAVAGDAAYCASVEGLFRVSKSDPKPALLVPNMRTLVTAVAADAKRVVWVRDTGPDRMSVEMLSLAAR